MTSNSEGFVFILLLASGVCLSSVCAESFSLRRVTLSRPFSLSSSLFENMSEKSSKSTSKKSSSVGRRSDKVEKDSSNVKVSTSSLPPVSAASALPVSGNAPLLSVSGPGLPLRTFSLLPPRAAGDPRSVVEVKTTPSLSASVMSGPVPPSFSEVDVLRKEMREQFKMFSDSLQPLLASAAALQTPAPVPVPASAVPVSSVPVPPVPVSDVLPPGSGFGISSSPSLSRQDAERQVFGPSSLGSIRDFSGSDESEEEVDSGTCKGRGHDFLLQSLSERLPDCILQSSSASSRCSNVSAFLGVPSIQEVPKTRLDPSVEEQVAAAFAAYGSAGRGASFRSTGNHPHPPKAHSLSVDHGSLEGLPLRLSQSEKASFKKGQKAMVPVPCSVLANVQTVASRQLRAASLANDSLMLLASSLFKEDHTLREEQDPDVLYACLQSLSSLVAQMSSDSAYTLASQVVCLKDHFLSDRKSALTSEEVVQVRSSLPKAPHVFSQEDRVLLEAALKRQREQELSQSLQIALKRPADKFSASASFPPKQGRWNQPSWSGPSASSRGGRGKTRVRATRGRPSSAARRPVKEGNPR